MAGNAWPQAVCHATTARQPATSQEKWGKLTVGGTNIPEHPGTGKGRRDSNKCSYAEHRTKRHRLERVVDSDDRERRRRAGNGRGPAPEVSCSPPAKQPRPPLAPQRETYRLELRGSCGRVQASRI